MFGRYNYVHEGVDEINFLYIPFIVSIVHPVLYKELFIYDEC